MLTGGEKFLHEHYKRVQLLLVFGVGVSVLMAALFQTRQPVTPCLRAFDDTGLQGERFPTGWAGVLRQLA